MKKTWLHDALEVTIILLLVSKIVQLCDRLYNIFVLNEIIRGNKSFENQLTFINQEFKIENIYWVTTFLVFIILFSIWLFVNYKKAHQASRTPLAYKSIWALFAFVIPVFNFIAPYRIMQDLWRVNNRDMSIEAFGRKQIITWWVLSLFILFAAKSLPNFIKVTDLKTLLNFENYYVIICGISVYYFYLSRKIINMIDGTKSE